MRRREQSEVPKEKRKFVKLNSVLSCLKCSICMEIFYVPTRLFCGHTFCYDCISSCVKSKPNCPICRQDVSAENVGNDLLAFNLIKELQVFCLHDQCSWKGELQMLPLHIQHECIYAGQEDRDEKQNKPRNQFQLKAPLDQEVQQKINENINKGSLISRAMKSDDSMRVGAKFDIIRKMIGTDSNTVEKSITPALNKKKKKGNTPKEQEKKLMSTMDENNGQQMNNYDFLMQLYE